MYAIDTNIIIRFLTQDDEQQYQKAKHIIQTQEIFIPDTVILEIEWVLRYAYGFHANQIAEALLSLINAGNIYMTDKNRVFYAVSWYKDGLDFGDALHLATSQYCLKFITFDIKLIKRSKNKGQCLVVAP